MEHNVTSNHLSIFIYIYIYIYIHIHIYIIILHCPYSHVGPPNCGLHLHENPLPKTSHTPVFLQGLGLQGFVTSRKVIRRWVNLGHSFPARVHFKHHGDNIINLIRNMQSRNISHAYLSHRFLQ